jgi:hypothetical protein
MGDLDCGWHSTPSRNNSTLPMLAPRSASRLAWVKLAVVERAAVVEAG